MQLGQLQKYYNEIKKADTEIIAIAFKGGKDVKKTLNALEIEYILVPGPQKDILDKYGIMYKNKNGKDSMRPSTVI
jgi:peroxiredoxin